MPYHAKQINKARIESKHFLGILTNLSPFKLQMTVKAGKKLRNTHHIFVDLCVKSN